MTRNKITPLRKTEDVDNITETEKNLETPEFDLETSDILDSPEFQNLDSTVMGSLDTSTDTSGIDTQLASLDAPKSANIWDKQAASYRQQGEGKVLRIQKNLTNLFGPTLKVIAAKEKIAEAKFNTLKSSMKEFDDSKIFGQLNNSEIDIATEAKGISATVKEDMRKLSRMNINNPNYDELRKKIESDQGKLASYDVINKTLLDIRNSGVESKDWSKGMTPKETAMWQDIFTSNGENISIEDGKMYWQGEGGTSYEFVDLPGDSSRSTNAWQRKRNALMEDGEGTPLSALYHHPEIPTLSPYSYDDPEATLKLQIKYVQKNLNKLYPDLNLDEDGVLGPKTQAAHDRYISEKDKLEKEYFDENMSVEDKKEYQKTTPVDRIELNGEMLGAGPKLLSSQSTVGHRNVSSAVIEWKNNGGKLGEMYEFQMGSAIQDYLDGLDEGDVKSLIFDGFGDVKPDGTRSAKKAYSGFNTEGFMMDVIKGTYGEDMDEEGIEAKVNEMRGGSMYDMYTLNGEKDTLKNHFDNWYREEQKTWFEKDTDGAPIDPTKSKNTENKKKNNKNNKNNKNKITTSTPDFNNPYLKKDGLTPVSMGSYNKGQFGESFDAVAAANLWSSFSGGFVNGEWRKQEDGSWKSDKTSDVISGGQLLEKYDKYYNFSVSGQTQFAQFKSDAGASATTNTLEVVDEVESDPEASVSNLDYVVDNIWEPNTPKTLNDGGRRAGQNGYALAQYFEKEGLHDGFYDNNEQTGIDDRWTYEDGELLKFGDLLVGFDGEYIAIFERRKGKESYKQKDRWGGDSTFFGDETDIKEIFKALGISGHLEKTR